MPLLLNATRSAARAFEPKPGTNALLPGAARWLNDLMGRRTLSGKIVNEDAALGLSAYYRGIAIRSNVPGTLPVHAYRKDAAGHRSQIDNEYAWIVKPNREVSKPVFWVTVYGHLSSWNNAFIWVVPKDRTKPPSPENVGELYPVEPKRVRWGRDEAGDKVYVVDGTQPARDWTDPRAGQGLRLVHIQGWGTDGMAGRPVWELGKQSIGIGVSAQDRAAEWFDKDTSPVNGYLSTEQELTSEEAKEYSEAWDDERKAADAGTPVLGKGTKWITTDIDPQKLQLLESRSYSVAEAARLTGVPENLLGSHDKTSSWGAGIAEQNRGLLTYTIDPDMVIVETTCSDTLMRPGDYMKVERGGLLRGSPKEQAEVLEIERRNLVINADEWRELTDREPLPNGQGQAYINPNTSKNGGGAADQGQTVAEPVPAGA